MINLTKYVLIYIFSIVIGLLLFVAAHRFNFGDSFDYLFFRSLGLLLIDSLILLVALVILIKVRASTLFTIKDVILIIVLNATINWNIYGLIPFNVSRCNSIIILNHAYLKSEAGSVRSDFNQLIESKYILEYDAIGVRLREQLASGNIKEIDGNYFITDKGRFVAETFSCISIAFAVKNNFLKDVKCEYAN